MCKNHDQQHYSPMIRSAASTAALGNETTRDLLLQVWTYHGLLDWMDRYGDEMASVRQDTIRACIRREHRGLRESYDAAVESLIQQWQEELMPDLDTIPY